MDLGNRPIGEAWGRKPLAFGGLWLVYRIEPVVNSRGIQTGERLVSGLPLLSDTVSKSVVEALNQKGQESNGQGY